MRHSLFFISVEDADNVGANVNGELDGVHGLEVSNVGVFAQVDQVGTHITEHPGSLYEVRFNTQRELTPPEQVMLLAATKPNKHELNCEE